MQSARAVTSFEYQRLTRCVVRPAKNGPKYRPPLSVEMIVWVAAAKMPYITLHAIRTWSITTSIVDICTEKFIEGVFFECTNGLAEQPRANEQEKIGHNHQEEC